MRTLQNLCTFTLLFCFCFSGLCAQQQQKTAYEKKKEELLVQMWDKYGRQRAAAIVNTFGEKSDEEIRAAIKEANAALAIGQLEKNNSIITQSSAIIWYGEELLKAMKLKTEVDFKREREAAYMASDAGKIQIAIKNAFEKWNIKGEFEKASDYEARLKAQSRKEFERICIEEIQKIVKDVYRTDRNRWQSDNNDSYYRLFLTYDSESESYTVLSKIAKIEWESKVKVPIDEAKKFKQERYVAKIVGHDYDWCFIDNNLCPTLVTLRFSSGRTADPDADYKVLVSLKNQRDIVYAFDDLGIDNPYLKGLAFNYSDLRREQEKIRAEEERLQAEFEAKWEARLAEFSIEKKKKMTKIPCISRDKK